VLLEGVSAVKSSLYKRSMKRRDFLSLSGAAFGSLTVVPMKLRSTLGPAIITFEKARPSVPFGVQAGDVLGDRAIIWSCTDRPARMMVEFSMNEAFTNSWRMGGLAALQNNDFTVRIDQAGLPSGQQIYYRVTFEDLRTPRARSEPMVGRLRTAPSTPRDLLFAWSGDTAGQGWGINLEWGGMKIFETLRKLNLDFFIHSGDTIYADGPMQADVRLDDGRIWKNIVTPEKYKVAESLHEFRGNYRYNLLDQNLQRFNAEVPQLVQWDDHEVRNNWYPGQYLEDERYTIRSCDILAARGRRAFLEYLPIRSGSAAAGRIYRAFNYGPTLEVIMLDERSYRGPNTANRQSTPSRETAFLGTRQLNWVKRRLVSSKATWKVMASDMPIGLIVSDGQTAFENSANGNGPALGRELEIANLLSFIKLQRIKNVVWLTADVHYAAAHHYDPSRAQFTDFRGFWEFVAGPLNAGTFGPAELDNTFGPEVRFNSVKRGMKQNRPPSDGLQFFGTVRIDGKTSVMTVRLHNLAGEVLYSVDLDPEM
jgi:alkaline phosphatase D